MYVTRAPGPGPTRAPYPPRAPTPWPGPGPIPVARGQGPGPGPGPRATGPPPPPSVRVWLCPRLSEPSPGVAQRLAAAASPIPRRTTALSPRGALEMRRLAAESQSAAERAASLANDASLAAWEHLESNRRELGNSLSLGLLPNDTTPWPITPQTITALQHSLRQLRYCFRQCDVAVGVMLQTLTAITTVDVSSQASGSPLPPAEAPEASGSQTVPAEAPEITAAGEAAGEAASSSRRTRSRSRDPAILRPLSRRRRT